MPALQYLNKELHAAGGRRTLHEPRKTDLQKVRREARIQARKRLFQPAAAAGPEAVRSCMRQTAQMARGRPLHLATGAIIAGIAVGLLLRRR